MSLRSIEGKKILLLCPAFFGYEEKMASKMKQMGAEVDLYDERSVKGGVERAFVKVFPSLFNSQSDKYYETIIETNKYRNYDYILIIRCDMVSVNTLRKLKQTYPNAKLCLYLWDSIKNNKGIENKIGYFDTIHSFDAVDCKNNSRLKFRPLFFSDEYRTQCEDEKEYLYDIVFIGTAHTDRYEIISRIETALNKKGLTHYWFLYLQNKYIYWVYFLTKKPFRSAPKGTFSFVKLKASDINDIVSKSKCVLDIEASSQTGLTMRTIEMLGLGKKLLTTNKRIKEYDFYNQNNIQVIERTATELDIDFFNKPYEPIPQEVYEKYSIGSWILETLD